MTFIFRLIYVGTVVCLTQSIFFSSASSELIEPTRGIGEKVEEMSRLTVLSEPPGLKISIDGKDMGKTPAFMLEVKPGIHKLRVKDSETEIYVEPGKTLKISLFKDEFVRIPVKAKEPAKQLDPVQKTDASTPKTVQPAPAEIRKNENRERAKERWQKFVDGRSPAF